jgi:hypothetical protein
MFTAETQRTQRLAQRVFVLTSKQRYQSDLIENYYLVESGSLAAAGTRIIAPTVTNR